MLAEACATRKPVHIFDLGEGENAMRPATVRGRPALWPGAPDGRARHRRSSWTHIKAFLYRQLMRFGPQRLSRDIRIIHTYLVDSGRAVWLGDAFPTDRPLPPLDCLGRATMRVRALVEGAAEKTTAAASPARRCKRSISRPDRASPTSHPQPAFFGVSLETTGARSLQLACVATLGTIAQQIGLINETQTPPSCDDELSATAKAGREVAFGRRAQGHPTDLHHPLKITFITFFTVMVI